MLIKNKDDEIFSKYLSFGYDDDGNKLKVMKIFNQLKQPFKELETLLDEHDKILKAKTMYRIIITLYRIRNTLISSLD
jgi:hypothetical protein